MFKKNANLRIVREKKTNEFIHFLVISTSFLVNTMYKIRIKQVTYTMRKFKWGGENCETTFPHLFRISYDSGNNRCKMNTEIYTSLWCSSLKCRVFAVWLSPGTMVACMGLAEDEMLGLLASRPTTNWPYLTCFISDMTSILNGILSSSENQHHLSDLYLMRHPRLAFPTSNMHLRMHACKSSLF